MPEIPLTQGMVAMVDDEDFEYLNQWKWFALKCKGPVYAARNQGQKQGGKHKIILMHRLILNVPKNKEIDHKDGDGLNNLRSNIRICNHQENHFNSRSRINTSSMYKGVYWDGRRKRWRARLGIEGKMKHIGYFNDEIQAALAYNHTATIYFGEFARLNILWGVS